MVKRRRAAAPGSKPVAKSTDGSIVWPGGTRMQRFYAQVAELAPKLCDGRVLAIDPASGSTSQTGWALFEAGEIVSSGTVMVIRSPRAHDRIVSLFWRTHDLAAEIPLVDVDVLAIELLRGRMVSAQLYWAVGALLAALPAEVLLEVPIPVWKAFAAQDASYAKGDEADARTIGQVAIHLARGLGPAAGEVPARRRPRAKRTRS